MQFIFISNESFCDQVIIQGFKSYREQTVVEPFDPRHNVVGMCIYFIYIILMVYNMFFNQIYE